MLACFTDWILLFFFFMFNLQLLFLLQSAAFLWSNYLLLSMLLLFWKDGGFDNACKGRGGGELVPWCVGIPREDHLGHGQSHTAPRMWCANDQHQGLSSSLFYGTSLPAWMKQTTPSLRFFPPPSCISPWAKKLQVLLLHPHVIIPAHMFSVCLSVMQDSNSMCWLLLPLVLFLFFPCAAASWKISLHEAFIKAFKKPRWLLLFFPSCRKLNFHWGNL